MIHLKFCFLFLVFFSCLDLCAIQPGPAKILTISGELDLAPYTYLDDSGNSSGYSVELVSEILRDSGFGAEFSLSTWSQSIQNLASGKSQIALDLFDSASLNKYFTMTLPVAEDTIRLYVRKGGATNLAELSGKNIVVAKSTRFILSELRAAGMKGTVKTTESSQSAFTLLNLAKIDCVIAPQKVAVATLIQLSFNDIVPMETLSFPCSYRFAVRKGDRDLLKTLNDGILRLRLKDVKARMDVVNGIKGGVSSNKFVSFSVFLLILVSGNGCVLWFLVIRKRIEAKKLIDENKASYSGVFNAASDTLVIFDSTGRIVDVNIRGEEVFGFSKSEFLKLTGKKLFHPGYHKQFEHFINVVRNGQRFQEELVTIHKDNSLISVDLKGSELIYNGELHLLAIIRDITIRKKVDQELRESKERAESAAKAKSDFLANMSHEIRTPLNGVIGLTEILSETDLDDEQDEYIRDLGYSGEMLRGIINDILDFSKIEAGKLELDPVDFNLYSMLDKLCCTFRYQAELNDVKVEFEYDASLPKTVNGDSVRIRQVFTNLIGNAIKFTSTGSISVRVNPKIVAHDHVIYIFEVVDTGVGIPKDKLNTLFDQFTQADMSTSRKFGGTGLGLTIAKQLVDKMAGTIYVKSQEGTGTTFSVIMKLPTVREAQVIEDENVEIKWDRAPQVLLAEDNLINQKVAVRFLEDLGCDIDVAMNGITVLDNVRDKTYDLIFMDIQMPDMDGVEATKAIREHEQQNQRTPIIALTAHALKSDHDQYLEAGMDSCLTKPISKNKLCIILIKTLSHLLRGVDSKTIQRTRRRSRRTNRKNGVENLVYDRKLALGLLDGDTEFLNYLLEMFTPQAETIIAELSSAIQLQDMPITKHAAHSLKGIAAQIGAQRLEVAAHDLEKATLSDDEGEVEDLIILIEKEYHAVREALTQSVSVDAIELPLFQRAVEGV